MDLLSLLTRPILTYWARKARPRRSGIISIPGLAHPVEVRWDAFAIPHIRALNQPDLFAAQGYLHAQDRLWQMDLNRRFYSGCLAEIFGDKTLPYQDLTRHLRRNSTLELDYFMRVMGIRDTASRARAMLLEDQALALEAYCRGVNAYIEEHRRRLPVEFRILRYEPAPWLAEDCLTVVKGFALLLSSALLTRVVFATLADRLGNEPGKLGSLAPSSPDRPSITHVQTGGGDLHGATALLHFLSGTFTDSPWCPSGQGSNSWTLNAGHGENGHPFLCNDPHLRLTLPCVWFLNHLRTSTDNSDSEFAAWGASVPGSPYIYIGHNRHIAWGITASLCDDADLFHETLDPADSHRYRAGDTWATFSHRTETIPIRNRPAILREVRLTRHGPVLSDVLCASQTRSAGQPNAEQVLSLQWTGHLAADEMRSVAGINQAQCWPEFLDSLAHHVAPALNYVYADVEGNIGYTLAGKIPIRGRVPDWLPLAGATDNDSWRGYIPFEELPRLYNPSEGVIATANNQIADGAYPYYLSELFEPPHRIERIRTLLMGKSQFSGADMALIQQDTRSGHSLAVLNALESELRSIQSFDSSLRDTVSLLLEWDGHCTQASQAAGVFHVFYARLMWNVWGTDLGPDLFAAYTEILNTPVGPLEAILKDPASEWFSKRSLRETVLLSLREARSVLVEHFGNAPANWAWGKFHTLQLEHALSNVRALASYFSLPPIPSAGDRSAINNAHYRGSLPYQQTIGASLRLMVSLEQPIRSRVSLCGGQSGDPQSSHYGDQFDLWSRGDYIQLAYSDNEMKDWPLLVLRPHAI